MLSGRCAVPRVQLGLKGCDLHEAAAVYSKLFDAEPAKLRSGYANFALADPPLLLVLIEDPSQAPGSLNHLGVEVASTAEVAAAQARLAAAGLPTMVEEQTACCYAVQDKVWTAGPGGERWEIYTVLADADVPAASTASGCCT